MKPEYDVLYKLLQAVSKLISLSGYGFIDLSFFAILLYQPVNLIAKATSYDQSNCPHH
ncbi:MAG: hypothetical protein LV481_05065 [Methylacidiphilales bacterium]|nr:hypothetical protein [Candidatus Methylacidiphilales bacterium]